MTQLVAGVDTSTQSCKILIVDTASNEVVRTGRAAHPAGTQVDPAAWWDAFQLAVAQAGGLADVDALSVGGQQHGLVALDANGDVIRPAMLWNDTSSAQAALDLISELGDGDMAAGKAAWIAAVGSVPVASLTVTKLRWLADHEPQNAAKIAAIALPHDWLTWKIGGSGDLRQLCTDRSDASGTGYVDAETGAYRKELLARALRRDLTSVEEIILPQILGPRQSAGRGAAALGWEHLVLGPGCGDNAGAALGLGLKPGEASLSVGTSGVVAAISAAPFRDETGLVTGFMDANGAWLPLACTLNGAQILDAVAKILDVDHAELDRLALVGPAGAGGIVLTPYFEGERTPNLPDATASFTGLTLRNFTRENLARAAVEGLLTLLKGALEAVTQAGSPISKVKLVGGGARSEAVRTLAPQILGIPVEIPADGEYVALGAARQAAWQLGQDIF